MDKVHGTTPTTVITDREKTLKTTQPHAGDARAHETAQKPVCDTDIGDDKAPADLV